MILTWSIPRVIPANYYGYYNLDGMSHEHEYVANVNLMTLPTKNLHH